MGINGIEGVFRRCCETTMGVMRNSHEGIVTIVEVSQVVPFEDLSVLFKFVYLMDLNDKVKVKVYLKV